MASSPPKRREDLRGGVAGLTDQVHDFVVAEHRVDPPAGRRACASSAISRSSASRIPAPRSDMSPVWTSTSLPPVQRGLAVDQTGALQDRGEVRGGAVDVADRDDPGSAAGGSRARRRAAARTDVRQAERSAEKRERAASYLT